MNSEHLDPSEPSPPKRRIQRRTLLKASAAGAGVLGSGVLVRQSEAAVTEPLLDSVLGESVPDAPTGVGIDRIDAPLKVSGRAMYPTDFHRENMAHAVLVQSTIAAGRIREIDTGAALAAPGVLSVTTYRNAPKLKKPPAGLTAAPPPPLQTDAITYYGQDVAMVVAETFQQATEGARLVSVVYDEQKPVVDITDPRVQRTSNPFGTDATKGDVARGLAEADIRLKVEITTESNTNNPLGLFATLAYWSGDTVTVHDSTQWPSYQQSALAGTLGLPEKNVQVLVPFIGGAFGNGLRHKAHTVLAAVAARELKRPVRLVLTRKQMFTSLGHRPATEQTVELGARQDGVLTAIRHESNQEASISDVNFEPVAGRSDKYYASPNILLLDHESPVNRPVPTFMRAPGDAQNNFALETAMDELAYRLHMDPIELRLRNYAETHPLTGQKWSSRALRECYARGAEVFGWSERDPEPRSSRKGNVLVGYGMASAGVFFYALGCQARAAIKRDGTAVVGSAGADLGTGAHTVMSQLASQHLGLHMNRVEMLLGDSSLPAASMAGASGLTAAMGAAVVNAASNLVGSFLHLVRNDHTSPLRGLAVDDVTVRSGRIFRRDNHQSESYVEILERHRLPELTAEGRSAPPADDGPVVPTAAVGAKFAEVHVDADLGTIRVARLVSVIDGGRILNEKTARSQIIGGTVGGIGHALLEETVTDTGTGRIANGTLSDYLLPVNADIPDLDVHFVGSPDTLNPVGVKGIGEIGLVGVAAAIGNAVYHATGKRVNRLPITLDQIL